MLTFPSFCGKAGREVLKTIVLAYVLAGPFTTISNNAKEVVRVFGCKTVLTYNLTKTRYELMVKPFQVKLKLCRVRVMVVKGCIRGARRNWLEPSSSMAIHPCSFHDRFEKS